MPHAPSVPYHKAESESRTHVHARTYTTQARALRLSLPAKKRSTVISARYRASSSTTTTTSRCYHLGRYYFRARRGSHLGSTCHYLIRCDCRWVYQYRLVATYSLDLMFAGVGRVSDALVLAHGTLLPPKKIPRGM